MSSSRTDPNVKSLRRSGAIATAVFLIVGTLQWWKLHFALSIAAYVFAGIFFVMTRFFPSGFMIASRAIVELVTRLILAFVFYLVVTPTGLLIRLFGRDPLDKRIDKRCATYWVNKSPGPEDATATYERQF